MLAISNIVAAKYYVCGSFFASRESGLLGYSISFKICFEFLHLTPKSQPFWNGIWMDKSPVRGLENIVQFELVPIFKMYFIELCFFWNFLQKSVLLVFAVKCLQVADKHQEYSDCKPLPFV